MFDDIFEKLHEVKPFPRALVTQTAIFGDMAVCGEMFNRSLVRVYYLWLVKVLPDARDYPWWTLDFLPTVPGEFSGNINQGW